MIIKSLKILLFALILGLVFLFSYVTYIYATLPEVSQLKTKNPESTAFIEYRKKSAKETKRAYKIRKKWISLKSIPKVLEHTIIVAEDASFWVHDGIDLYEVKESFKTNWEKGRLARGGSTITQQLAKNLYLSPKKSILRKIEEMIITREIEKKLSKSRILELYINNIELGRGIFGIFSASEYYFNKRPEQLTISEMIRLCAIIPKPLHLRPDKATRDLKWRSKVILIRLFQYEFISKMEYEITKSQFQSFFGE
jgi:monofunctional biosynthetic peptidoglycan transglycosylase